MSEKAKTDMPREVALIRELSLLFGPSGYEGAVADAVENKIRGLSHSLVRDRMGNIIARISTADPSASDRRRVMLSAHMDEVGVMISEICDDGLLRFDTVGGIDVSVLEGRTVTVGDERGCVRGLVASKAIHHIDKKDRSRATKMDKLYIDIGAKDKEDAERYVSVGSLGTFDSEFYLFGEQDGYMKGKALDDRMGCAALIEVMESIVADPPSAALDLYFCFTVREEIGLSGAKVVANRISPDLAIVLESTAIADLPDVDAARRVADVGSGGVISVMDRSTIYDRGFIDLALACAKEQGIPAQLKRYVSGGNDAGSIHKSGAGVRTLAISVPTRYLHSPSCVAAVEDFRSVRRLVEAIVRKIDADCP